MSIATQQHDVPALRFPEFSGEWVKQPVGNLAKVKTGSKDTQNRITNGKYPFYVRSDTIERINSFAYDGEAVLTSGDGVGVGKNIHYVNEKFDYHQRVYAIYKFGNELFGRFFFQFFKENFLRRVMRLSAKNSVDSVRMFMIADMLIPTPSIPEQQKIAVFLSNVDTKIEQLSKKKEFLEQYKKGMMQKLFSQQIRFKDDNGNDYPDWEDKLLGEITTTTTGSSNREDSTEEGKYAFFDRSSDKRGSSKYLYDSEAIIVAGEGKDFPPRYFIGKFDLHQRAYATIEFRENSGKFLYYWIYWHRSFFLKYSVGSTMPSLRMDSFTKFPIRLPHPDEQTKIANFLSAIDDKINLIESELTHAKTFKKGLLQQMFV